MVNLSKQKLQFLKRFCEGDQENPNIHFQSVNRSKFSSFLLYTPKNSFQLTNELNNVVFNSGKLFCFTSTSKGSSQLLVFETESKLELKTSKELQSTVIASCSLKQLSHYVFCVLLDGFLWKFDLRSNNLYKFFDENGQQVKFSPNCFKIQAVLSKQKLAIVGLTSHLVLFINNKILSSNCTSFVIFNDMFILYTTTDNSMHCISLNLTSNSEEEKHVLHDKQNIERGARIVAITKERKVILQMPRGNLETVQVCMKTILTLKQFNN